ncbi:MAG: hypothetical protein OXG85_03155 [Chloroflexi bacterium]|nr:hypothetical protein [Chloroflexota bacterium]
MIPSLESTNTDVTYNSRNRPWVLEQDWTVYSAKDDTVQSEIQKVRHRTTMETPEISSATIVTRTDAFVQDIESDAACNRLFGATVEEMLEFIPRHLPLFHSVSSTTLYDPTLNRLRSRGVMTEVQRLFSLATFVDFESGMTNDFSDSLEEVIETFGEVALEHVQGFVLDEKIPFTIAAEVLRYIGNIESGRYVDARRNMLESCLLNSRYMLVRDGAAAGLSYIDDSRSISCLQRAIKRETHNELKKDLNEVLQLLQDTSAE